jgi:uncharacterized membrane protein
MADPPPTFEAHRLGAGRYVSWLIVVVCVLGAVDIVASGQVGSYAGALLVIGAVCLVAYVLGMRPAVLEEVEGVRVRNPLRTAVIPWVAVTHVDVTDVLRVHADDRVVRCFAIPRRRPHPDRPALGLSRPPSDFGFADLAEPARAKKPVGPPVSRADMVAARLREQSDRAGKGSAAADAAVRLAPDALWALVGAGLLLALAVVL